jgi:hypothetical protein
MTQGEHGDEGRRQIHIRLEGGGARDLGALHRWLSREDWFVHAQQEYGLRVAFREEDGTERAAGPDGPPMGGLITDLVLLVAGAAIGPVFDDLYTRAKAAVRAWAENSGAEPPHVGTGTPGDGPGEGTDDGEGGRIG